MSHRGVVLRHAAQRDFSGGIRPKSLLVLGQHSLTRDCGRLGRFQGSHSQAMAGSPTSTSCPQGAQSISLREVMILFTRR
jgi:hypothetical protein